jgi:hypothetical protein
MGGSRHHGSRASVSRANKTLTKNKAVSLGRTDSADRVRRLAISCFGFALEIIIRSIFRLHARAANSVYRSVNFYFWTHMQSPRKDLSRPEPKFGFVQESDEDETSEE